MVNTAQVGMVDHSGTPGAVNHPEAAWRQCGLCLRQENTAQPGEVNEPNAIASERLVNPGVSATDGEPIPGGHLPGEAVREASHARAIAGEALRLVRGDRHAAEVGRRRLNGEKFRDIAMMVGLSLAGTHKAWMRFRRTVVTSGLLTQEDIEEALSWKPGARQRFLEGMASGRAQIPAGVAPAVEVGQ